jgi:hypothetical protein
LLLGKCCNWHLKVDAMTCACAQGNGTNALQEKRNTVTQHLRALLAESVSGFDNLGRRTALFFYAETGERFEIIGDE